LLLPDWSFKYFPPTAENFEGRFVLPLTRPLFCVDCGGLFQVNMSVSARALSRALPLRRRLTPALSAAAGTHCARKWQRLPDRSVHQRSGGTWHLSQAQAVRCFQTSRRISGPEVVKFHLSDIGEGIKEVTVKEWFVSLGDKVAQFDNLCEVQSDKASVTITSRYDGIIRKIYFEVDDVAQTGDALVDIELESSSVSSGGGGQSSGQDGSQPATSDGESNDKPASATSSASSSSEIQETEALNVGEEDSEANAQKRRIKALATPAVRRIAAEHGVSVSEVAGSGKDGRVLKEDILSHVEKAKTAKAAAPAATAPKTAAAAKPPLPTPPPPPVVRRGAPVAGGSRQDRVEPLKGIQKAMMKTMSEALQIPHFGYCDEIDVGKLVALRNELKEAVMQRSNVKLSYMPFILKACSMALLEYPTLNATFDPAAESLTIRADHNIGLAMDTAQGLLVPNIKKIQDLSVFEIASELNRLHALGLAGKLGGGDLNGGTFALSNIGSVGGTYAKPVILPPQVAIGALGKVQNLPRFDAAGNVVKASVINVSWSADHRVLDGATVARFSNLMKDYIENPTKMVLDLR